MNVEKCLQLGSPRLVTVSATATQPGKLKHIQIKKGKGMEEEGEHRLTGVQHLAKPRDSSVGKDWNLLAQASGRKIVHDLFEGIEP